MKIPDWKYEFRKALMVGATFRGAIAGYNRIGPRSLPSNRIAANQAETGDF